MAVPNSKCHLALIVLCFLHAVSSQLPEKGRLFPYDRAEKYHSYWYSKGEKDIQRILNLRPRIKVAKNVILFLGDGMGVNTLTASRIYKGQRAGSSGEEGSLFFETFPYSSLVKVPDSAGTATAFLTGVKGNFETIGVNAHVKGRDTNCNLVKDSSVPSILKWAVDGGKHAGVVTTARITHATPAASYAHSAFREWENDALLPKELDTSCKDIARQLIEDEPGKHLRVILGGGRKHFLPSSFVDPASNQNGARNDENLIQKWLTMRKASGLQSQQYKWINSTKGLLEAGSKNLDQTEYLFGLFNYSHMAYEEERDRSPDGEPSLTDMTTTAIRILRKNENGFVLLVEGARIDHAHHKNLAGMALRETVSLDEAVEAAAKIVNMDETLIIVTADHAHTLTINGYPARGQNILGLAEQNDTTGLRFETLMYGTGPGHVPADEETETTSLRHVHQSAVHMTDSHHGGEDVAVYSDGPFAHLFQGLQDQTFIAHVISFASCTGNYNTSSHCDSSASSSLTTQPLVSFLLIPLCATFCSLWAIR